MNIVFDNIIFSLQRSGGISVVWEELLKRVIREKDISTLFIEYNNHNINRNSLDLNEEHILPKGSGLVRLKRYFNPKYEMNGKHIFHSSYYRTSPRKDAVNITTVHDFTYEYYYKGWRKSLHCFQKYNAIRNSDYIICISDNTKKDLLKFVPDVDESKIRVIYNGVSGQYRVIESPDRRLLPFEARSFVLFVGSREPYKNFNLTVEAIACTDLNLVVVGGKLTEKEEQFLTQKLGTHRYKGLSHITNEDLNLLYNAAHSLLYPSSYEGFGIPVIEAQKAGCPVIAYRASSIPEVIGNSPLLMEELTPAAILESLEVLSDSIKREEIVTNGFANSERFTWDNMYKQTLGLYRESFLHS